MKLSIWQGLWAMEKRGPRVNVTCLTETQAQAQATRCKCK